MNRFGLGTALASAVLAGGLMISGAAYAQSSAYAQGSTKDPAACTESCQKERESCLSQMSSAEMCAVDYKVCTKQCQN
jgi:predicted transglutaminase-like cysteine proteinase